MGHPGAVRARLVPLLLAGLALGVAAVVALLLARSIGLLPTDFRDTPYYEVLYDDDATAAEVVEVAEAPEQVAMLDDGTEIRLYGIRDQEGGDAAKAVVQVRRPGGEAVQRLVQPMLELTGVGDHAVLHSQEGAVATVDPDGSVQRLTRQEADANGLLVMRGARPEDGIEPGDVLVGNVEKTYLYRPSDRSVHVVPRRGVQPQTVPYAGIVGGRVWFVDVDDPKVTTVRWSDDARTWRSVEYATAGAPQVVGSPDGQTVALAAVDSTKGPFVTRSLHLVRGDGSVRDVPLPEDDLGESSAAWTPDGRVLLGNSEEGWWRLDGDDWTRLDVPGDASVLAPAGDRLYGFGTRGPADAAWVSDDAGGSWEELGE